MNLKVRFDNVVGRIKPVNGVGQPPFVGINFSHIDHLTRAHIPYSRLHDVGGAYGGGRYVDIPNIFRNFDADPYLEDSYDFAFTDLLITALVERGVEPYFRLGVTIENYAKIKAYNIYPPRDFKKWAVICEHIIRHYTEGWANGFKYKIKYWEIWNEPDNYEDPLENQMWRGVKEEYYELYDIAAKHLKEKFPDLKIGGYGSCGFYSLSGTYVKEAASSPRYDYFITFFDGFLDYIKEHGTPIDFFSWHSYDGVKNNTVYAEYAKKRLDDAGLECEIHVNEWNTSMSKRGSALHASLICEMMLAFQHLPIDVANFYDAQIGMSVFGSMFNCITREPYPAYYAFSAFGELYSRRDEVECEYDGEGICAIATKGEEDGCIVISNTSDSDIPLTLDTDMKTHKILVTSDEENATEHKNIGALKKHSITVIYTKNDEI